MPIMTKEPARGQAKHFLQIKYLGAFPIARCQRLAQNPAMTENAGPSRIAPYPIAVIMERVRLANRWATERWEAKGVVQDPMPPGSGERVIVNDERITQILYPGFMLKLYPDEAEGYLYNVSSPEPKVFIMWRMREDIARPESLTVSYHEGARWMDTEETVGGVALPPDLLPWIAEFAALHYKPEPKKKKRYASSKDKGVASHRDGTSRPLDVTE
jgi:hypothetical protein